MPERTGRILLIEDNQQISEALDDYLSHHGYAVEVASDGPTGLRQALSDDPDAIVLDGMLPGMDGLEVCRQLRRRAARRAPLLMLTARDTLEDKLAGLAAGADDYLIKPFDVRELEARLRSMIRRDRRELSHERLRVGDLELDSATQCARRAGRPLELSPIGLRLLTILMRASPHLVSRGAIEREIWGGALPDSDTLRSHLYNLRQVIDKPFDRPLLHTVHSTGYRLADLQQPLTAPALQG